MKNTIVAILLSELAYIGKQPDGNWIIVGKTTAVEGKFDLYCSIR
jgi:hypothetical protein